MKEKLVIPSNHPRAESLKIRERLNSYFHSGIVVPSGLIAHGRGEAYDYLFGEKTIEPAQNAIDVAVASFLLAKHPVISVNGNVVALAAEDIVKLAEVAGAALEVNLFYRSLRREQAVEKVLKDAGAKTVLGVGKDASATIPELGSERRKVDPRGILASDVILVPLEDGDRTEALVKMGKCVIAVDLNPLSRTSRKASITIVDNVVRVLPRLVDRVGVMKSWRRRGLLEAVRKFDNKRNLELCIQYLLRRLSDLSKSSSLEPAEN